MTAIANYSVLAPVQYWIRDSYWDRASRSLRRRRLALRLRQIDGESLVALKGEELRTPSGVSRLELEGPWSTDILAQIMKRIGDPPPKMTAVGLKERDAYTELERLGFNVIQRRETYRRARPIVPQGRPDGPVLAEVAVDDVAYQLRPHPVRLHEIEIEAKGVEHGTTVDLVARAILKQFGPDLQSWPFGKLATGEAINHLLRDGKLTGLIDDRNNLVPEAYPKIRDYLLEHDAADTDSGP